MASRSTRGTTGDPDARKGAVEGDRPDDPQHFNPNAGALGEDGLPAKMEPICEDAIGANVDNGDRMRGTAGEAVVANETGDTPSNAEPGSR